MMEHYQSVTRTDLDLCTSTKMVETATQYIQQDLIYAKKFT